MPSPRHLKSKNQIRLSSNIIKNRIIKWNIIYTIHTIENAQPCVLIKKIRGYANYSSPFLKGVNSRQNVLVSPKKKFKTIYFSSDKLYPYVVHLSSQCAISKIFIKTLFILHMLHITQFYWLFFYLFFILEYLRRKKDNILIIQIYVCSNL